MHRSHIINTLTDICPRYVRDPALPKVHTNTSLYSVLCTHVNLVYAAYVRKLHDCLENQKGVLFGEIEIRGNAHAAIHLRTIYFSF